MPGNAQGIDPFPIDCSAALVRDLVGGRDAGDHNVDFESVTRRQAHFLYLAHSLSMWNSRMYEFGVILFIQAAFPGSLTASSVNGIAETVCVLLFSSALGRWVDRTPSRLRALLLTIVTNRITVLVSCLVWFLILSFNNPAPKQLLFALALVLGMIEKLSRATNILSVERDWVPTLASPCVESTTPVPYDLTHLNTVMRRIDMLCKLIAPLAVSMFVSTLGSETVAVVVIAAISTLSWGLECWCVQQLWNQSRRLRARKEMVDDATGGYVKKPYVRCAPCLLANIVSEVTGSIRAHVNGLRYYFGTSVWIPSVCAAIPHGSVLTFSGTMITYLLNAGFSLNMVTGARASGALFEISSTFIFPWAVRYFSANGHTGNWYGMRKYRKLEAQESLSGEEDDRSDSEDQESDFEHGVPVIEFGVVRVGTRAMCGLFVSLPPALVSLFYLDSTVLSPAPMDSPTFPMASHPLPVLLLILCISLSLFFRWTYDLSATQLTQTLVPATHRSSFGGIEMSIVSVISLAHWVAATVWHMQSDFKWLAFGSFLVVGIGTLAYWGWARWWEERQLEGGSDVDLC